ncbi:MAG: IS1634 family transposase [bacterium]
MLIQKSVRQGKKVIHQTLANITKWPEQVIEAIEFALKGGNVKELQEINGFIEKQGKAYGALKVIVEIAKRLGIREVLGRGKTGILTMIMIAGMIITQKSRWHIANYWVKDEAIEEVLGFKERFDEDDLYETLAWLSKNQGKIEDKLWQRRIKERPEELNSLFLYDVTKEYVEGEQNELAEYGRMAGGVKGKKVIAIGLLTDKDGDPLTVEVFKGNTSDHKTVIEQLKKIREHYGTKRIVFVGDRGMLKSQQIEEITKEPDRWNYITAITKPQIEGLINDEIIQLDMFDNSLCEVENEGIRYILRKNPMRAEEIRRNLEERIKYIEKVVGAKNEYLDKHKKAKREIAQKNLNAEIEKRQLSKIITLEYDQGFRVKINEGAKEEVLRLAGCYVIKTDVPKKDLSKEDAHARYKDLTKVEHAFEIIKTGLLRIHPIHVRKEESVRGHVFVCMLAYKITHYIESKLKDSGYPLRYIIETLDKIQYRELIFKSHTLKKLPDILSEDQTAILNGLGIKTPFQL